MRRGILREGHEGLEDSLGGYKEDVYEAPALKEDGLEFSADCPRCHYSVDVTVTYPELAAMARRQPVRSMKQTNEGYAYVQVCPVCHRGHPMTVKGLKPPLQDVAIAVPLNQGQILKWANLAFKAGWLR